jgi:hypothetical protein
MLMATEMDEAGHVRRVEEDLLRRFGGQLPEEWIHAEIQRALSRYAAVKVRTFIPVLLQREVTDSLRRANWRAEV